VSEIVTLSLRSPVAESLEVEGLTADRCEGLSEREIAALPVWAGAREAAIGDFFDVRGGGSSRVRIEGSLAKVDGLAAGNASGEVLIDGDAGARVAAGMIGGRVEVRGHVGHEAGVAMAGGVLRVHGGAGDRLGAAVPGGSKGMTGGEIVVTGSAGADAASRVRRGLIVVGGNVGADAGRAMIAGTLVVRGSVPGVPGRGNKRGSIVGLGPIAVPATYRYACTFEPPYVRFVLTYLVRHFGLEIDPRIVAGRYRRHCGDAGMPGKGEILEWTPD
jgi:formylmethanofuran dehydrogenase subunit C